MAGKGQVHCRVVVSDVVDPYSNLALEELLLEGLLPREVVLYLWQNDDTVVIGKNQNAWRECRVEEFEADGGRVARRLSGGGAVYHDLGNQNFTFLARAPLYDVARQTEVVRLAARRFGIEAVRSGRNDILADGRKFSGNAFYSRGEYCYHHGTILLASDMGRLAAFLAPSKQKLAEKGVASVRSRVVNLCELAPKVTPAAMRQALVEAMGEVYACGPEPLAPERIDEARHGALRAKYASEEWRLGRRAAFGWKLFHRFGFGEVELQLDVREGCVQNAAVYTDALEDTWVEPLKNSLPGCVFAPEAVFKCVAALGQGSGPLAELAHKIREEMER